MSSQTREEESKASTLLEDKDGRLPKVHHAVGGCDVVAERARAVRIVVMDAALPDRSHRPAALDLQLAHPVPTRPPDLLLRETP